MSKFESVLDEVKAINVSESSEIRIDISKKENDPIARLDIRTFIETANYKGATKKGVNIPIELLPELIEKLQAVNEEAESKGY